MGSVCSSEKKEQPLMTFEEAANKGEACLVSVTIASAKKLKPADPNGLADPYVVVKCGDYELKTKIVKQTLEPVFNDHFDLLFAEPPDELTVEVWDWDRGTKDDLIGGVPILLDDIWDFPDAKYQWLKLRKEDNSFAGGVHIQVKCTKNIPKEKLHHYSISHLLQLEVVQAENLKSMDFIGKNDPYCSVSWGDATFKTRTAVNQGKNPEWRQSCFLWIDMIKQYDYKMLVQVLDEDRKKDDTIGAAIIDASDLFHALDEILEFTVDLRPTKMTSDAELSEYLNKMEEVENEKNEKNIEEKEEKKEEKETCGKIRLICRLRTKGDVFNSFFSELLSAFDTNKNGSLSKIEAAGMLRALNINLSDEEFDKWFNWMDASEDGEVTEDEWLKFITSCESQKYIDLSKLMIFLENGPEAVDSALMGGVTHPPSDKDVIRLKDHKTGLIIEENIPTYIQSALKSMYQSKFGRAMTEKIKGMLNSMSIKQGEKFDLPESRDEIDHFIDIHKINIEEIEKDVSEYKSMNEFFARRLKPNMRDIDIIDDKTRAVCPADCRLMVFNELIDATKIWVKGDEFSIGNLIGDEMNKVHGEKFMGGSFVIARLAPQDYHRFHIPCTGKLGISNDIGNALYTVSPIAIRENVNVYTENKRRVIELHTEEFGLVLVIAVGATMVGSIVTLLKEGDSVTKGDEHGYFQFGGSTVLLLFQPGRIKFDPRLLANSNQPIETLVRVGTYLGRATKNNEGVEIPPTQPDGDEEIKE